MTRSIPLNQRLEWPIRGLRQQVEGQLQRVAQAAPRCLPFRRHPRPDPEQAAILMEMRSRLRAIHEAARHYLPAADAEGLAPNHRSTDLEEPSERRPNHHGDQ